MKRRQFLGTSAMAGTVGLPLQSPAEQAKNVPRTQGAKPELWMLLSHLSHPAVPLVSPTIAWIAKRAGVAFENYLEAQRDGRLFARTGSTVLGGHHHQQFNYLNAAFDVKYIILDDAPLFRSSIKMFHAEILAESNDIAGIYDALLARAGISNVQAAIFAPTALVQVDSGPLEIVPYLFPDIYYRQALAFPVDVASAARSLLKKVGCQKVQTVYLAEKERDALAAQFAGTSGVDDVRSDDNYGSITLRIAARWKSQAKGLAFADPAAILSQIPKLCRENRLAVYAPKSHLEPSKIAVNGYQEEITTIAPQVVELATELNNLVMVGRQTTDGDLLEWAKGGVCLQIMDPNRPAFPMVEAMNHVWTRVGGSIYDDEPDDNTLRRYAEEKKILITLLWHSGEMAHTEAMLNLFDLVCFTGLKMGVGVHAARYETAPQLWELLNISRERGGVRSYIEPVLYSGGMGIMAEINCPPKILKQHCVESLARIRKLAGDEATPRGHHAFLDSDLATYTETKPELFQAIEESGLQYAISLAKPGRNRALYSSERCLAINQTPRHFYSGSPFVRIRTEDELSSAPKVQPGWLIATFDSPVHAFNQYIWKNGKEMMSLFNYVQSNKSFVNVLPHTVARYARLLKEEGYLPS